MVSEVRVPRFLGFFSPKRFTKRFLGMKVSVSYVNSRLHTPSFRLPSGKVAAFLERKYRPYNGQLWRDRFPGLLPLNAEGGRGVRHAQLGGRQEITSSGPLCRRFDRHEPMYVVGSDENANLPKGRKGLFEDGPARTQYLLP